MNEKILHVALHSASRTMQGWKHNRNNAKKYARKNGAAGIFHADDSYTLYYMEDGKLHQKFWKTARIVHENPSTKAKRATPGRSVTAPRKTYRSAKRHTRKATTKRSQRQWEHVYESARKQGFRESDAIKIANGVTKKSAVRVRKNPLKRAAKRSTSFGRRSDAHVIVGLRRGPGKRIKHFYFTGDRFTDHREEANIYATRVKAIAAAKAILERLPESIVSLKVVKP